MKGWTWHDYHSSPMDFVAEVHQWIIDIDQERREQQALSEAMAQAKKM